MTPASLRMNYISELKNCGDPIYKLNQYWEKIATAGNPHLEKALSEVLNLPVAYIRKQGWAWMVDIHKESNLKVGGGLDDVWLNKNTEELHIVDYKSTSQKSDGRVISLDDPWKEAYKRQMDLYVWVMMQKGFNVSRTGYFLYCDGDRFSGCLTLRVSGRDGVGEDKVFAVLEVIKGLVVRECCDVGIKGPGESVALLGGIKDGVGIQGEHVEQLVVRGGTGVTGDGDAIDGGETGGGSL